MFFPDMAQMFSGTTPAVTGAPESQDSGPKFYQEVWFIVLMVLLGVLLLLIICGCCVRHCGHRNPYIRERLPLQSRLKKKSQPPLTFCVDANDGSLFAMVKADNILVSKISKKILSKLYHYASQRSFNKK